MVLHVQHALWCNLLTSSAKLLIGVFVAAAVVAFYTPEGVLAMTTETTS